MKSFVATCVAVASVLLAPPAQAHEEITPVTVPTGKAAFLTLLAANETRSALTRITVTAPDGVELGATTRQPSGWTAERSAGAVTWTGGSLDPGTFEEWGFEIEAVDQPGTLRFRVASAYTGGGSDTHTVLIDAVAPGTTATTSEPTVTVGTAPPEEDSSDTTTATQAAPTSADEDSDGKETLALALAGVALLLSLVALVAAVRGGRAPAAGEPRSW